MTEVHQPPLQAALGDEDILDESAKFDLAAEIRTDLETPSNSLEQLAQQLQRSDAAWLKSTTDDVWNNVPAGDPEDPHAAGAGVLLKVPASGLAVTKGSFTAFTIPAQPKPRESYKIVIEVRLPENVRKYRVSDLSGEVTAKVLSDSMQIADRPTSNQNLRNRSLSPVLMPSRGSAKSPT